MRSASSHQKSSCPSRMERLAPQDATNATVIASAMRSIMPGFRDFNSESAPVRNGLPPHTYITVPSTGDIHAMAAASMRE